ncbi:hypothetical protein DV738_g150, partial [Chaetothyriales sp. CBS 135597]
MGVWDWVGCWAGGREVDVLDVAAVAIKIKAGPARMKWIARSQSDAILHARGSHHDAVSSPQPGCARRADIDRTPTAPRGIPGGDWSTPLTGATFLLLRATRAAPTADLRACSTPKTVSQLVLQCALSSEMSIYSQPHQPANGLNGIGDMTDGQGTINPAALNSGALLASSTTSPRGLKRSRSPDAEYGEYPGGDDDDETKPRKRGRPPKVPRPSGDYPSHGDPLAYSSQVKTVGASALQATTPRTVPAKPTTLKALPTVRDHTTDQLTAEADEYVPRDFDEAGDKKVDTLGYLQGGREYKIRTFTLPGRGQKLFMLATECARCLQYRDSYLLFNKNRSLYKIIASVKEKEELVSHDILPYSYRSRQIAIVTARSMFRQFGSRVIKDGRRVRDDYWEAKAIKQGFTEQDPAGEKRPGAARAREAAAAASLHGRTLTAYGDVVYSNGPGFGSLQHPPAIPPGMPLPSFEIAYDPKYRDIPRPRQELTGAPYLDTIRPSSEAEMAGQAGHAAEYSRSINQQGAYRRKIVKDYWHRPHEPPVSTPPAQDADPATAGKEHAFASPRFADSDTTASQAGVLPLPAASGVNPPSFAHSQNPLQSPPQQGWGGPPSQAHQSPSLHRVSTSHFSPGLGPGQIPSPLHAGSHSGQSAHPQQSMQPPQMPMMHPQGSASAMGGQQLLMPGAGLQAMNAAAGYGGVSMSQRAAIIAPQQKPHTQHDQPQAPDAAAVDNNDSNRKRKREPEDEAADEVKAALTEEQIRSLQSQHKIRIVNLRKLHKPNSKKSRKQQKEGARLFPPLLTSFAQLSREYSIGSSLDDNVRLQGYHQPTEVQMATIPLLLDNLDAPPDLLTIAPTGSGKTLAYLIPLIEKIRRNHHQEGSGRVRRVHAVILAPTKELVGQIVNEARKLTAKTGVTVTEMKKGIVLSEHASHSQPVDDPESDQDGQQDNKQAKHEPTIVKSDIIVATPLSLVHSLAIPDDASSSSIQLPTITTFVLDEADVLLDPLFRVQTLQIWSALSSPSLRVSLWSATIGSSIEDLAMSNIITRRRTLSLPTRTPPILRCIIGLKDSSLPTINHRLVYAATEAGKLLGLRQLIHPSSSSSSSSSSSPPLRPPFLIFTQTIARATALHDELKFDIPTPAGGASRIALLHSDLSSTKRADVMTRFRLGQIWILITTDLLSRGVDFRGVNGVVNYDIPTTSASYVHRAGRTGRAGRQNGLCITFYTREDIKYLRAIASPWMLDALPDLTKQDRKELRQRGVQERRAIKQSDTPEERKKKSKNRIGTKSGYDRPAKGD